MNTEGQKDMHLSKSLFIRGLQCGKSLYLHQYSPELKDPMSSEQEALFQRGFEVGKYAHQLFPGGVEIPCDGLSLDEQVEMSRTEIAKGTPTLYEAAFRHEDVYCRVDILHKGDDGWEIHEVKSSASLKDVHIDDVAVQYYVVSGTGLPVTKACLVHINNQYVRQGDIEPHKLFTTIDLTDIGEDRRESVGRRIKELKDMLAGDRPAVDIGPQCSSPYICDFKGHCWQDVPEDSVFTLGRKGVDRFSLYRQGIVRMEDIPLDILNRSQRIQVEALKKRKERIDRKELKAFLETLTYPLYFLDFETFMTPIPLFDGLRPYQQVTFQYSLHRQAAEGSELRHSEFIASPGKDPQRDLIEKLLSEVAEEGSILVYTNFEVTRLKELAAAFPEHKEGIDRLISRTVDLSVPFNRMDYYHWRMNGSFSLKTVLPTLMPDMSYEGMAISDGGMAMDAYFRMNASDDPSEVARIRKDLLDYCKLDTLAMVRILAKLKELAEGDV